MAFRAEMSLPREAKPETVNLFNITEKIPTERKEGFADFLRGVNYGLDMAGCLTGWAQAETPQAKT